MLVELFVRSFRLERRICDRSNRQGYRPRLSSGTTDATKHRQLDFAVIRENLSAISL